MHAATPQVRFFPVGVGRAILKACRSGRRRMTLGEINGRSNNARPHWGIEPPPLVALQRQYQRLAPTINRRRFRDGVQPVEAACDDIDRHDRELARLDSASSSLVMRSSGRAAPEAALSRFGGTATRSLI